MNLTNGCFGIDPAMLLTGGIVALGLLLILSVGWNIGNFFRGVKGKTLQWVKKTTLKDPKTAADKRSWAVYALVGVVVALLGYMAFVG